MSNPKLRVANYLGDNFSLEELEETSVEVFVNHFQYNRKTVEQGLKLAKKTIKHNREVS